MMKTLRLLPFAFVASVFADQIPDDLVATQFSGPDITPSPACIAAAPTGEVFVGVDMNGSLGKLVGKGKIVRLIDSDHDGVADSHTEFAKIDNPRGLIPLGKKLIVLHTVIPEDTGKLSGMHLSVLTDENWDGVADGPPEILVSDVSPPLHNQNRGADHTTNGIALGIDGWVYIAVGDFGMVGARGKDGRPEVPFGGKKLEVQPADATLTMLGGGVVRVRPDGSELEVYTTGLRNIYDVAIDPRMNIYTRGNTNDGGGWNVRFIHHIQSAHYGYPMHFKNFTDEILPALQDLGGGSGTGAMYLSEPGWPEKYNNQPLMCDWGRSTLFIHRVTPDGATFTQKPEDFLKISQIVDVDVDGSSALYAAAWAGAGYKGSDQKGYVSRIVPKDWKHQSFPDLDSASQADLIALLKSDSAKARTYASQQLVAKHFYESDEVIFALAEDPKNSIETRIAAIFTVKQMVRSRANPQLIGLAEKFPEIREWALRAAADRKSGMAGLTKEPFIKALRDPNPRVQVAAAVALGRLGDASAAEALLAVSNPPAGEETEEEAPEPPVFASEKLEKGQTEDIDLDISDFAELHLYTTDGGNGNGLDHSAWFDATLVMADGSEKPLIRSAKRKAAKVGYAKLGEGKGQDGKVLMRADGTESPTGIYAHAPSSIVYKLPEGTKRFKATIGLAKTAEGKGSVSFVAHYTTPQISGTPSKEGPHATPNSPIVVPHVAVAALNQLEASDSLLAALDGANRAGALWALKYRFEPKVVETVLAKAKSAQGTQRAELTDLLCRLYQREKPYDGSWWWGTRPDTRGPFYYGEKWEGSAAIEAFLLSEYKTDQQEISKLNERYRMELPGVAKVTVAVSKKEEPKVDLSKIAGKAGEIGKMSIEDVMLALDDHKGNAKRGKALFTQQGCQACHTIEKGQPLKGPDMGMVGAVLSREQIAESILKPNASISQGFKTVAIATKDGKGVTGFVTAENADEVELRDIAGNVHKVKASNIANRQELEISMMPPGLANALSVEDFASLVAFLASQKG